VGNLRDRSTNLELPKRSRKARRNHEVSGGRLLYVSRELLLLAVQRDPDEGLIQIVRSRTALFQS